MIIMIILLIVISFAFMEFVAWSNHKRVMHGFLGPLHNDFRNLGLLIFPGRFFD